MIVRVKIFNSQHLLALATCIQMRLDKREYDTEGVLVRTVSTYDKNKIQYDSDGQIASVVCESKLILDKIIKSGFNVLSVNY